MSEKNVGDMSVICRKEKYLKTNTLSFYGKWVTDNKCRYLCRRKMLETSRVVKRDLAVMQKVGILRHEGKDNVGVCCLLAKLAFL